MPSATQRFPSRSNTCEFTPPVGWIKTVAPGDPLAPSTDASYPSRVAAPLAFPHHRLWLVGSGAKATVTVVVASPHTCEGDEAMAAL